MSNMSYCRFENTLNDLRDCYDNLDEEVDGTEKSSKESLIKLCKYITEEYGEDN